MSSETIHWKPVIGYEGHYEVSNSGKVRALERMTETIPPRHRKARVLRERFDSTSTGYSYVSLSRGGRTKKLNVHVLVLEAFVGPRPSPAHEACHGDGNRRNANLSNLRWAPAVDNHRDKILHGTHCAGEKIGNSVLTAELVTWIRESPQSSLRLAPILGVASSTIRAVRINQNWRAA